MKSVTVINPKYSQLASFVDALPQTFEQGGEMIFNGRNVIKVFSVDGLDVVVKKFKNGGLFKRAIYSYVEKSKAKRGYEYALRYQEAGINTPQGYAYLELYDQHLLAASYLLSERSYYRPVTEVLVDVPVFDVEVARAVGRFVARMHEAGILHGDLNSSNFLYQRNADASLDIQVIDINRTRFKKQASPKECFKDLMRINSRQPLRECVARSYAEARHWDVETCVAQVNKYRNRFDTFKATKRKLGL